MYNVTIVQKGLIMVHLVLRYQNVRKWPNERFMFKRTFPFPFLKAFCDKLRKLEKKVSQNLLIKCF